MKKIVHLQEVPQRGTDFPRASLRHSLQDKVWVDWVLVSTAFAQELLINFRYFHADLLWLTHLSKGWGGDPQIFELYGSVIPAPKCYLANGCTKFESVLNYLNQKIPSLYGSFLSLGKGILVQRNNVGASLFLTSQSNLSEPIPHPRNGVVMRTLQVNYEN